MEQREKICKQIANQLKDNKSHQEAERLFLGKHACMYTCERMHPYKRMYACMQTHACIHTTLCMHACMHARMDACMQTRALYRWMHANSNASIQA